MISVRACVCVSCYAAYTIICLCDSLFVKLDGRVLKTVMRETRENIFADQDGRCKESVIIKILL